MAEDVVQKLGSARSFEDLWIWQQARGLVSHVYLDFGPESPGTRDYGFRRQVQEAAVSIMNNIAEGFERRTDGEFARFLDIAKGSCGEVRSMYYAAEDLRYVARETAESRRQTTKRIAAGIAALSDYVRTTSSQRESGRAGSLSTLSR